MATDTITLGADVGGPEADAPTLRIYMPLRQLLAKHCIGPYSKDIDEFAFVLRIDGRIAAWNFEGCEELKLVRRERYITIDIGVPHVRWQVNDDCSIAKYLIECVEEGLRLMIGKLRKSKLDIQEDRLLADFARARNEYLRAMNCSDWGPKKVSGTNGT